MQERVHKLLAHAGFGSRRACEELIEAGRVTVNGQVITLGDKAELGSDEIRVDGRRVKGPERQVYYLLNKPPGVICTNADPGGRQTAAELLTGVTERVYPVGRLDADSRGLLILTNDGDLAARLTHPKYEVPKTYEAEIDGRLTAEDADRLTHGIWLAEGKTSLARIRVLHRGHARSQIEITLREGRNRQVRRMLAKTGHKVRRLTRTRIGSLTLRGLGVGKFRRLTAEEVERLYRDSRKASAAPKKTAGKKAAAKKDGTKDTKESRSAAKDAKGKAAKSTKGRSAKTTKRAGTGGDKKRRNVYDFTA